MELTDYMEVRRLNSHRNFFKRIIGFLAKNVDGPNINIILPPKLKLDDS